MTLVRAAAAEANDRSAPTFGDVIAHGCSIGPIGLRCLGGWHVERLSRTRGRDAEEPIFHPHVHTRLIRNIDRLEVAKDRASSPTAREFAEYPTEIAVTHGTCT
jgi:hypothetical protein